MPFLRRLALACSIMIAASVAPAGAGETPTAPHTDASPYSWSSMPRTGYCAGTQVVNGGAVAAAQVALVGKGYYLSYPVDGLFGPISAAATTLFQRDMDIAVDGCIGPQTWTYLQRDMIRFASPNPDRTYFQEGVTCCHVAWGYGTWYDSQPNNDVYTACVWTITLDDNSQRRPYTSITPASVYRNTHVRMKQPGPLYWTVARPRYAC